MREAYQEPAIYVAPKEPPPSRKPPITTVGPLGWARQNLFSSPVNTVATVITLGLTLWFVWSFLVWAVTTAQWAVVYNNLRQVTSGQYVRSEIWRIEMIAAILVFLTGLSLGIWGFIARSTFVVVIIGLAVVLLVPLVGARIPPPSEYVLVQPQKDPMSVVFVGQQGQDVTFSIDPLNTPADAEQRYLGYIEQISRTDWSTQARAARDGKLDLSDYTLTLTVTLLDKTKAPVLEAGKPVQVVSTPDDPAAARTVTLPADGWYVIQVARADSDAQPNAGYAWLKVDGVNLFAGLEDAANARIEDYGPVPDVERPLLAQEDLFRFEGQQSFAEFIKLQIAPLFNAVALELVVGTALFVNAWVIGVLGKREKRVRRSAVIGWIASVPVILLLLSGIQGSRQLPQVPSNLWGGLLLTILLTVVGITASFPLGVALALGRRSELPVIKWTSTLIIETVRGVPLITILFMAKLIVPFFATGLANLDLTIRMMIGLTLFSAAYLAENVRGGLQIIPHGQIEAARALGMNPALTTSLIVLPQALRAVIPAIVGQFIALFKDTSLVAIVGLFELVGIVERIVSGQPAYRPYQREAYIFIAIIYFVISYAMSDVSRRLEASGAGSVRH